MFDVTPFPGSLFVGSTVKSTKQWVQEQKLKLKLFKIAYIHIMLSCNGFYSVETEILQRFILVNKWKQLVVLGEK